jgi:predicted ATPase/class 3 adenylate cyclase
VAICPSCGEENSQRARFCQACATPLPLGPVGEVRKTVTVLFSDVVGSTELADRLDTESFTRLMNQYFQEMKVIAERHGGTVAKFIGDAIVTVFGIPLLHEDDALRAVRAAWDMRSALVQLNEGFKNRWDVCLATRTGVNSGEVLTGAWEASGNAIGGAIPGGHIAIGDAMNLGARVEQAAEPGEILLGEATYRLVRDVVDAEPMPPRVFKGKSEAARIYRLLRVSGSLEAIPRRLHSPMVGRRDDVATLEWAVARAAEGRSCRVVTILGPAGVGKSRLVREFLAGAPEAATVLRGRCLPYGEGITFWPLAEVVKNAAGITDEDSGDQAVGKIATLLTGAEDARSVAELVGRAIGLSTNPGTAQETFWSVRKLFENLARDRPLIVVFDDIHWAERTFLDLVEDVAEWVEEAPVLVVCTARPELLDARPDWTDGKRYQSATISLVPLAQGECDRLLLNLPGGVELGPNGRDVIVEASGGNPLFLEQMLSMLVDDGLLEKARSGSVVDVADISAPPSIQALLAARLDRLSGEERQVIERAAVQGKVFYRDALSERTEDGSALSARLLALIRKQLIDSARSDLAGQEAFRFVHGLVRDSAYQGIPKDRRAALHAAFAGWLEGVASDRVLEYEEILAYHLEQAYQYRAELGTVDEDARMLASAAAERMGTAAERALARGDAPGAVNLLTRATALLHHSDPRQPHLLLTLAEALAETGELEREGAVLGEAMDLAAGLGDRRLQAHVSMVRARQRSVVDSAASLDDISREADLAIPIFEELSDHRGLAAAWRLRNWVAHQRHHHAEALQARTRAYEHAHRAGDPSEIGDLSTMAASITYGPTPVREGIRRCEEILEQVKSSRGSEGFVLGFLGILHAMDGRSDRGRELIRRGAAIGQELGLRLVGAATRSYGMGNLELLSGDPAAAEREFRQGFEVLDQMGEQNFRSTIAARLAGVLCTLGRHDEAERFAQISRETSGRDDLASQVVWRGAQAKVLMHRNQGQHAEELASEAVTLAARTDSLNLHADALMDLAVVQRTRGHRAQAAASLRKALELYEQKGNVVSAGTTRVALKELDG